MVRQCEALLPHRLAWRRTVDLDGIVDLAEEIATIGREVRGSYVKVTASVSNFVPKAHTPYLWNGMHLANTPASTQVSLEKADDSQHQHQVPRHRNQHVWKVCSAVVIAVLDVRSNWRGSVARVWMAGPSISIRSAGGTPLKTPH